MLLLQKILYCVVRNGSARWERSVAKKLGACPFQLNEQDFKVELSKRRLPGAKGAAVAVFVIDLATWKRNAFAQQE